MTRGVVRAQTTEIFGRQFLIDDFRGCENDDTLYKKAFERLLKSLVATEIEPKEG